MANKVEIRDHYLPGYWIERHHLRPLGVHLSFLNHHPPHSSCPSRAPRHFLLVQSVTSILLQRAARGSQDPSHRSLSYYESRRAAGFEDSELQGASDN